MLLAFALMLACNSCFAEAITFPESVVLIGDEAFADDAAITELIVPEGVAAIGERAFAGSGLTEITLPSTLTTIAPDAFDGCDIEVAHAPLGSYAFEYCRSKGWLVEIPWSSELNIATYKGALFKVVNTAVDPFAYAKLVYDRICTNPQGTGIYSGYCLGFCYYYQYCMVDNITDVSLSVALSKYMTSNKLSYGVLYYSSSNAMMARLYDLLNAGIPQILMVEAITHPGSRHFVAVVGYRASVNRREDLRPEDLLILDSYEGRIESMDPAIDPVDTRVLFKQQDQYHLEIAKPRS